MTDASTYRRCAEPMPGLEAELRINLAIKQVKGGKLGVNAAAEFYSVPLSTLRRRLRGGKSRYGVRSHTRLSIEEEQLVLDHVLHLKAFGFPLSQQVIAAAANHFATKQGGRPLDRKWPFRFINRRPELSQLSGTSDTEKRMTKGQWLRLCSHICTKYGIRKNNIYSMDEMHFEQRHRPDSQLVRGGGNSLVVCVGSDGSILPPLLVVPHVDFTNGERSFYPDHWDVTPTANGFSNDETAMQWIRRFHEQTVSKAEDQWRMLLIEGHLKHCTVMFVEFCEHHQIVLMCLPSRSAEFTSPVQAAVCTTLQAAYCTETKAHQYMLVVTREENAFSASMQRAYARATMNADVVGAFESAGLMKLSAAAPAAAPAVSAPSKERATRRQRSGGPLTQRIILSEAVSERTPTTQAMNSELVNALEEPAPVTDFFYEDADPWGSILSSEAGFGEIGAASSQENAAHGKI